MPIWKSEDVFSGSDENIAFLVHKQISKGSPINLQDAKLLAVRNNVESHLTEEDQNILKNIELQEHLSGKSDVKQRSNISIYILAENNFYFRWSKPGNKRDYI